MNILFASNKGGVGKTTTLLNIAAWLQRNGKAVCLIKADRNNDIFSFVEKRKEALGQTLPVIEQFGDLAACIERAATKYEFVLVDCAGHDSVEFRTALQVCDLYLCLLKPSSDFEVETLNELTVTVRKAEKLNPKLRSVVVPTRVKPQRFNKVIELRAALTADPIFIQPVKSYISELSIFEDVCNAGVGVHECSSGSSLSKAKAQIELLCQEVGINR